MYFTAIVAGRMLWYLVSLRWHPKMVYLSYPTSHRFSNSYAVIDYRFRNALWYRLKGIRTTAHAGPLVLDLQHVQPQRLLFIAQGLFKRERIILDLEPQLAYQHSYAALGFSRFDNAPPLPTPFELMVIKPRVIKQRSQPRVPSVALKQYSHSIKYSPYKQSDFL